MKTVTYIHVLIAKSDPFQIILEKIPDK